MIYMLLLLSVVTAAGKAITGKKVGADSKTLKLVFRLNCLIYAIALVVIFLSMYPNFSAILSLSSYSLTLAVVFAAVMLFTQITQIKAMSTGSSSVTVLIFSCGFLIPTFYSAIVYNEAISPAQLPGIGLILVSLFLIINPKDAKFSPAWLLWSVLSMTGSGVSAILQKVHQKSPYADELSPYLAAVFVVALLFSVIGWLLLPRKASDPKLGKISPVPAIISGLCIGSLNILNLYLAGKIPAVIQFPVYNIGNMILTGVLGALIFQEKHTTKQFIGFGVGCLGILLIGLFQ